ncbi:putative carbonic anhydrase 5 [Diachasmimorpha longicaudata]|uniref:putative carbonic anhydrase 5 n=1 Tax=Diachasmimorpha longicaudata TaxID=58733 RepID=UPI0030B88664
MALSLPEFLIICGSIFLVGFLFLEVVNWGKVISSLGSHDDLQVTVVEDTEEEDDHGSLSGKESESFESPVNIVPRQAVVIEVSEPFKWNGYKIPPVAMTMFCREDTVIIQPFWIHDIAPTISGGPLTHRHHLLYISLHWGVSDQSGSEHSIDQINYPLEMQLAHVKQVNARENIEEHSDDADATIVSYLFQIKENDNELLNPIIMNVCRLQESTSKVYIPPFQLDSVFPLFPRKFYSYTDKLNPPVGKIVMRLIYPEPLSVSSSQMTELRKISTGSSRPKRSFGPEDLYYHE